MVVKEEKVKDVWYYVMLNYMSTAFWFLEPHDVNHYYYRIDQYHHIYEINYQHYDLGPADHLQKHTSKHPCFIWLRSIIIRKHQCINKTSQLYCINLIFLIVDAITRTATNIIFYCSPLLSLLHLLEWVHNLSVSSTFICMLHVTKRLKSRQ